MESSRSDRDFYGALVVFQESPVLDAAAEFCMQRGFAVLALPSYQEAMVLLQRQCFQFVIADACQQGVSMLKILRQSGLQDRMEHLVLVGREQSLPDNSGGEIRRDWAEGSCWEPEMSDIMSGLHRFRRHAPEGTYFLWQVLPDFHCIRFLFDIALMPTVTPLEKSELKKTKRRRVSFS